VPKVTENTKANATAKEASAKEKAARLRIVESAVAGGVKVFTTMQQKEEEAKASYFDCLQWAIGVRDKHNLDKSEVKALLTSVLARVFLDGDEAAMASGETGKGAYFLRSKFLTILCPKEENEKEVKKALAKGVDFGNLYKVATGNLKANEVAKKGSHGGAREKKKTSIDTSEEFQNLASPLISKAWNGEGTLDGYEGGLNLDEIEEAFAELIAGYREKAENPGGDESED